MSICHSLKSGAETRSMPGGRDCWIWECKISVTVGRWGIEGLRVEGEVPS